VLRAWQGFVITVVHVRVGVRVSAGLGVTVRVTDGDVYGFIVTNHDPNPNSTH